MPKRSYMSALLQGKCPQCREGDIFKYPVTKLSKFNVMNEKCPYCGVGLEPEPGFYQGAMYVGYAFTIAVIVIVGLVLYYLGDPSEWVYIGIVITLMLLLSPLNYRYSRILYLTFFGGLKYNPSLSQPK
ncbi:MAG TPA: DUF983 domain-containing protein [Chryseolinea sp.]|nr:DUF983 domain-containing protein [Chryseolinea sp.]